MLMETVKNNNSSGKWLYEYVSAICIALSEMKSTANAFMKLLLYSCSFDYRVSQIHYA